MRPKKCAEKMVAHKRQIQVLGALNMRSKGQGLLVAGSVEKPVSLAGTKAT